MKPEESNFSMGIISFAKFFRGQSKRQLDLLRLV